MVLAMFQLYSELALFLSAGRSVAGCCGSTEFAIGAPRRSWREIFCGKRGTGTKREETSKKDGNLWKQTAMGPEPPNLVKRLNFCPKNGEHPRKTLDDADIVRDGSLHSSGGHFQSSLAELRARASHFPLEELRPRGQARADDACRHGVPAPLLSARAPQRVRTHPPLRLLGESLACLSLGTVPATAGFRLPCIRRNRGLSKPLR